ncbi:unnamed protein product [Prorocentrum cordatum]|uniref:Uncharacterized protein n=1 Tax=Prorocentrum cordatum TaxID=2364126 RepID=A0ABN9W2V5_9DINO|nr:unnamed protein product [Polarella glacialis]
MPGEERREFAEEEEVGMREGNVRLALAGPWPAQRPGSARSRSEGCGKSTGQHATAQAFEFKDFVSAVTCLAEGSSGRLEREGWSRRNITTREEAGALRSLPGPMGAAMDLQSEGMTVT